jgi:chromatin segregation and condensation protein Rec8/ScpA/Scc1 (kleisin family)
VVTFLAVLELVRLKQFRMQQPDEFGEIQIERQTPSPQTPSEPAPQPPEPAAATLS